MSKKVLIIPLLILSVFIFAGCSSNNNESKLSGGSEVKASETKLKADKVQVFTFHATQRCATCIAIGKLSGEVVEEYYQPELRDGKIEVREINIDLPENKELAAKFQASGSALKINAIYDGQDNISEDTAVWRLTSNPVQYKSYLKNKIDALLGK
jgi:thioredoxin-related protein